MVLWLVAAEVVCCCDLADGPPRGLQETSCLGIRSVERQYWYQFDINSHRFLTSINRQFMVANKVDLKPMTLRRPSTFLRQSLSSDVTVTALPFI